MNNFSGEQSPKGFLLPYIKNERPRQEIIKASFNLADYIKKEEIQNVMFLDNSARQANIGLREAWKKKYEDKDKPNIYFINPKNIISEDDFPYFAEEFWKKYKKIDKSESVLLYDVCIHSGETMMKMKKFFTYLGFESIKIAIASPSNNLEPTIKDKIDFFCLGKNAQLGCHPFGKPKYVKPSGHITSEINVDNVDLLTKNNEHLEIKRLFDND